MSRMFLVPLVIATCLSSATAQEKQQKNVPAGTVRVAVVNIGVIFNKYEKAQLFKKELEELIIPFKNKGKALTDQMETWTKELNTSGINGAQKEQLEADILSNKRQLEEMQRELSKVIGKKQEDNLVVLWKEVQDGIKTCAIQKGIQLVLGYGDPMEKEMLDLFPNVNRKMQAMDLGSTVPLYSAPGVDIAEGVVELLNKRCKEANKTKP